MVTCPFCGCDPYEYVDNGVGMEAVAVTCCELGVELFGHRETPPETTTMGRGEFERIADVFRSMRILGMNPDIWKE